MESTEQVRKIEMDSIRSITYSSNFNKNLFKFVFFLCRNVKRDNRSVFLYAYENAEAFLSVEFQIFFSSAERRTA